jgi:hypothetical protein
VITGDIADEYDLFSNEVDAHYADEVSVIDLSPENTYTDNDKLHILLDRLNLLLAHGHVSDSSLQTIKNVVMEFPNTTATEKEDRIKLAIYLLMTSPEYLINR